MIMSTVRFLALHLLWMVIGFVVVVLVASAMYHAFDLGPDAILGLIFVGGVIPGFLAPRVVDRALRRLERDR